MDQLTERVGRLEGFAADAKGRLTRLEDFAEDAKGRLTRLEDFAEDAKGRLTHLESDMGDVKDRLIRIETRLDQTASKTDVAELKASLAEMNAKMDISSIRQTVEKSHTDIYKWVATIAISVAGLGFAVYSGIKSTGQSVQNQASPPIIINLPANPSSSNTPTK